MQDQSKLESSRPKDYDTSTALAMTVIISCAVIVLACVAALTIVLGAFFLNPPW